MMLHDEMKTIRKLVSERPSSNNDVDIVKLNIFI